MKLPGTVAAIRALLDRPEARQALSTPGSPNSTEQAEELLRQVPALSELAAPGSLFERSPAQSVTWAIEAVTRSPWNSGLDGAGAAQLDRLARALALSLAAPTSSSAPERSRRFAWVEAALPGGPIDASLPLSERLRPMLDAAGAERMRAFLFDGIVDPGAEVSLSDVVLLRNSLDASAAETLAARLKDVNVVLFSSACLDLAASMQELVDATRDGASVLPPHDKAWVEKVPVHDQTRVPEFAARGAAEVDAEATLARATDVIQLFIDARSPHETVGGAPVRIPIGPWPNDDGERLARALIEAARLALPLCGELYKAFDTPAHDAALGHITFQSAGPEALREGVVSIAQAIGLLLARPPDGASLDEALAMLQGSGLVSALAAAAPFAVVAPLATGGFIPHESINRSPRGRLRMPSSLRGLLDQARQSREVISADARSAYAEAHRSPIDTNRTETLRGCPVASRGLVIDADGQPTSPTTTPLDVLADVYIALVREVLSRAPADNAAWGESTHRGLRLSLFR
jgi:hypothetical protein